MKWQDVEKHLAALVAFLSLVERWLASLKPEDEAARNQLKSLSSQLQAAHAIAVGLREEKSSEPSHEGLPFDGERPPLSNT